MNSRNGPLGGRALCAAAGMLLASASAALADQVQLTYMGAGEYGRNVQVFLAGGMAFSDGSVSKSVWAGSNLFNSDRGLMRTWCAEVDATPGSSWFDAQSVDGALGGGELGQSRAAAVARLFAATHGDEEPSSAEEAAAFQAVLWEIVHDYAGVDGEVNTSAGNVRIEGIDQRLFAMYRNMALHSEDAPISVMAYTCSLSQDQFGPRVVPLPSAAGLGLLGLGLVSFRRVRRAG